MVLLTSFPRKSSRVLARATCLSSSIRIDFNRRSRVQNSNLEQIRSCFPVRAPSSLQNTYCAASIRGKFRLQQRLQLKARIHSWNLLLARTTDIDFWGRDGLHLSLLEQVRWIEYPFMGTLSTRLSLICVCLLIPFVKSVYNTERGRGRLRDLPSHSVPSPSLLLLMSCGCLACLPPFSAPEVQTKHA